jgi:hypothetical protein
VRKLSRKSKIVAASAALALTCIGGGAAFAYRNITGSTAGAASNPVGDGAFVLTATFAAGLAPGGSKPIAYTASNSTGRSVVVGDLAATVTTNADGWLPEWFMATAETSNSRVPADASGIPVGVSTVACSPREGTAERCESAILITMC